MLVVCIGSVVFFAALWLLNVMSSHKPSRSKSSGDVSGGNTVIEKTQQYHALAKDFVKRAINLEKQHDKQHALHDYQKAVEVLNEGISLGCSADACFEDKELIRSMLENKQMVEERLSKLSAGQGGNARDGGFLSALSHWFGGGNNEPAQNNNTPPPKRSVSANQPPLRPSAPVPPLASSSKVSPPPPTRGITVPLTKPKPALHAPSGGPAQRSITPRPVKGIDPKLQQTILDQVVDRSPTVHWEDIAGLNEAKRILKEIVILPSLRPEAFGRLQKGYCYLDLQARARPCSPRHWHLKPGRLSSV